MKHFQLTALLVLSLCTMQAHLLAQEVENGVYAHIYTSKGEIVASLDYENVPMTVSNFVGLAEGTIDNTAFDSGKPYYTNSKWHRVVPGHVIQGGSPNVEGRGGTGYSYPNEIYDGLSHIKAGVLGIANAGPHTNGSQFYITLGDRSYLDGNYSLFGEVVKGMDVVNSIVQGDVIERIEIKRIGKKAERFKPETKAFMKMVDKAKAKIKKEGETKKKKEDAFIAKNYPEAVIASDGIAQYTKVAGRGAALDSGTVVKVKYTGSVVLSDLSFVSTEEGKPLNNPEPAIFQYTIGNSKINRGLDLVISQMKVGEKRIAIIPAQMAYGRGGSYGPYKPANQRFVINPGSTLLYEIEVVSN